MTNLSYPHLNQLRWLLSQHCRYYLLPSSCDQYVIARLLFVVLTDCRVLDRALGPVCVCAYVCVLTTTFERMNGYV